MPMFGMKRCQLISSCSSSGKLPILFEAKALPSTQRVRMAGGTITVCCRRRQENSHVTPSMSRLRREYGRCEAESQQ